MRMISKDGRFEIQHLQGGSDHWMDTSIDWYVRYTRTGETFYFFSGDHMDANSVHSIEFSPNDKEVIAKNEKDEIVERVSLLSKLSTDLVDAVEEGNIKKVCALLENGADVETKPVYGNTVLMRSIQHKDFDIAKLLLEKDADVNAKSKYGETALMNSAKGEPIMMKSIAKGQFYIAKLLLEKGAKVNATDSMNKVCWEPGRGNYVDVGYTALMVAAEKGRCDIANLLLEKGADVNLKSKQGETALMRSARNGHFDTVELLLKKGAKVNAKSKSGMTAPMAAIRGGGVVAGEITQHDKVIKLLERAKEPTLLEKLKLMKLQEKARGKEEDRNE